MRHFSIIKRPLITEKTTILKDKENKIVVEVDRNANRLEIKKAVEACFDTKVRDVKTMNVKGKAKRRGKIVGKRKDWKKAIVTLMPEQRIDFFEGA
jgi:large subunit ribosomal protein L23